MSPRMRRTEISFPANVGRPGASAIVQSYPVALLPQCADLVGSRRWFRTCFRLNPLTSKKFCKRCLFQCLSCSHFLLELLHIDHVRSNAGLACRSFVPLRKNLLNRFHRIAKIADFECHVAESRGGFGLRFLDLDLRKLLL